MIARICIGLVAVLLATQAVRAGVACGGPEIPCTAGEGVYFVARPERFVARPERPDPGRAAIYLHGYGASGAKIIATAAFVEQFTARGPSDRLSRDSI